MDQYREGDTIEQSMCRGRTEEEQRAVEVCTLARVLLGAGAQEMRFDQGYLSIDASSLDVQGLKSSIVGGIIRPGMDVIVVEPGSEPAISPHSYKV